MVRIVSLVPAATEIVWALGATDQLVAVTHDDDFPAAVLTLPRVTRSTIPPGATARELCAVCAVTLDRVPASLDREPEVVPLTASSIEGMFHDIRSVGAALRCEGDADRLVGDLRARLAAVEEQVAGLPRPRVACLEWLDPLFNGGHWVPEQVRIAGGEDVLGTAGARSREIGRDDVVAARPEIVIAMPCGWDAPRAAREAERLGRIGDARIVGVDGAAYFSRPGPRLVDGVELLGSIFHPYAVGAPDGAMAVRV